MSEASNSAGLELIERARDLVPLLTEEAAESERLRRPTDTAMDAIVGAGLFELMVPRCFGGKELDLDTFVEVGLILARADASLAWVTTFLIEHNWMFCQFPESFQRELYADCTHVQAPGAISPNGKATRVDGGYRLSGRWQWATGVMHSTWAIAGAFEVGGEGPPLPYFFALPMSDVKIEDTWYIDGMCGTGSNDIVIDDVFVPADRAASIVDMVSGRTPGSRIHGAPLYRTPMAPVLMIAAATPIVGCAVAVAEGLSERLIGRTRLGASITQAEKPAAQMRVAQAAIEARQAELTLRDIVADVCRLRNDASFEDRARWSSSITHAVHQSRRVVNDVAEASGASAHFSSHPLQRVLRDVNVGSCHVAFDHDAQRELYGRLLLGLEPSQALF